MLAFKSINCKGMTLWMSCVLLAVISQYPYLLEAVQTCMFTRAWLQVSPNQSADSSCIVETISHTLLAHYALTGQLCFHHTYVCERDHKASHMHTDVTKTTLQLFDASAHLSGTDWVLCLLFRQFSSNPSGWCCMFLHTTVAVITHLFNDNHAKLTMASCCLCHCILMPCSSCFSLHLCLPAISHCNCVPVTFSLGISYCP